MSAVRMFVLSLIISMLAASQAWAQVNTTLPVQGLLSDAEGNAISDKLNITFSIYADAFSQTPLWSEQQSVTITNGLFTAYLGENVNLATELMRENPGSFLGMKIGSDEEMPRISMASAPYAAFSDTARDAITLGGRTIDEIVTGGTVLEVSGTGGLTGTVTTSGSLSIADSGVTTAKIGNLQVTEGKLSFDPATQSELNTVTSNLSTAGTVNTATNPVDWTKLKGVPATATGSATGLTCTTCVSDGEIESMAATKLTGTIDLARLGSNTVTDAQIAPNAIGTSELGDNAVDAAALADNSVDASSIQSAVISEAKLTFNPATQTELDAVALGLSTPGTINSATNPVDWTKLKGVPATATGTATDVACTTNCVSDGEIASLAASKLTGTIDLARLGSDTLTGGQISANAIGSSELGDNAVDSGALAANAVTTPKIADGQITTAKIADGNVTSADIQDGTVTYLDIGNGQVGYQHIAASHQQFGYYGACDGTNDISSGTITYGPAFDVVPIVTSTIHFGGTGTRILYVSTRGTANFSFRIVNEAGVAQPVDCISWVAMRPR